MHVPERQLLPKYRDVMSRTGHNRDHDLSLRQPRIGEDQIAHRLIVADITGASAEMIAERGLDPLLHRSPGNGIAGKILNQARRLVDEALPDQPGAVGMVSSA